MDATDFNKLIALGTVILQVYVVGGLLLLLQDSSKLSRWIARFANLIGFFIAASAIAISLMYSGYFGYLPCMLCWYQRIFLYPQAFLFGLALIKKDRKSMIDYSLLLSVFGLLVSIYHYYLEWGGRQLISCSTEVSCTQRYVFEFGYISIPLMALTGFAALSITMLIARRENRN